MTDKTVQLQSKFATAMLQGICKAFKIEPTVDGLIQGVGGDPAKVYELVQFVQANGERLTHSFEAAVTGTAERVAHMEAEQRRQALVQCSINDMLCALCEQAGIEHTGYLNPPTFPAAMIPHTRPSAE